MRLHLTPTAGGKPMRLRLIYEIGRSGAEARELARAIAYEQTVEVPPEVVSSDLVERVVGRVETVEPLDGGRSRLVISYDPAIVAGEIPQLFNLLFGNVSMYEGVLVADVQWPEELLARFPGPSHGIAGLRRICGVTERRPLLCAALKPVGLDTEALAGLCFQLARGGVDIIKDDHSLAGQATAPFEARLDRCQAAVERANRLHGGSSRYFPQLTGPFDALEPRLAAIRAAGCPGVLLAPWLAGPDTLRWIADTTDLAILAHPAWCGPFLRPDHGLSAGLLLGRLFRLIGADGVIYPNAGGRFPFPQASCDAVNRNLREPWGPIRPAFPVPGGGIDLDSVPRWIQRYGPDVIFLIGGSLYARPDLTTACRDLRAALGG